MQQQTSKNQFVRLTGQEPDAVVQDFDLEKNYRGEKMNETKIVELYESGEYSTYQIAEKYKTYQIKLDVYLSSMAYR